MPKKKSDTKETDEPKAISQDSGSLKLDDNETRPELNLNETNEKETPEPNKSSIKALVFLVIILLVLDIGIVYYKNKPIIDSRISDYFKPKQPMVVYQELSISKCSDGTIYESCSTNKPYYCLNGTLVKKANTCGCPSDYRIDFQNCKKISANESVITNP